MAMRITEEQRKEIKDEFLFVNATIVNKYVETLLTYWKSKELLAEQQIVDAIFVGYEKLEDIAGNILFTLATMEPGKKPLQSTAGMISGFLSVSDKKQDRINAMHTAMELLLMSQPFTAFEFSNNGYPMISSMICDEDLRTRNIYLPLDRPTDSHKELGSFHWKMSRKNKAGQRPRYMETLDAQNHIACKIVPLYEKEEIEPHAQDFSEEGCKQREKKNKQLGREYLANIYTNKPVYFNWASDYRGRIYSVGYYIAQQGTEVEKNMIQFHKGEKLTFKGLMQLKKSIASAYGLDKKTDMEKLSWFFRNESMLHLRERTAKEPYTFQALRKAYGQWKEDKEVEITMPVELDATNSQAQLTSVLLGKREIAETCNVINHTNEKGEEEIADLYQLIADAMSDIIAETTLK